MATQITHPHFRPMGETIDVGGNVNVQNVPNNLSIEELIAKARAPVKREYLRKSGTRVLANTVVMTEETMAKLREEEGDDAEMMPSGNSIPKTSVEKKSKRQQRRDRKEARSNKSVENLCGSVAKTGDVNACRFGTSCHFNHDLAAYLAQKPPDIPGQCPFLGGDIRCPYGYACRYVGTHPKTSSADLEGQLSKAETRDKNGPLSSIQELNNLNKGFQKLLWKNAVTFPKADAQLGALGLLGKAKKIVMKISANGSEKDTKQSAPMDPAPEMSLVESLGDEIKEGIKPVSPTDLVLNNLDVELLATPVEKISKRIRTETETTEFGDDGHESFGFRENGDEERTNREIEDDKDWKSMANEVTLPLREKKLIDFRGKLYLAPLTTVGNLPFRRVCKKLGADITCGEMAMCTNLLQGQASEWALLRRHAEEDMFGVQICGAHPDTVARAAELIERECQVDFIDLNLGCPIDLVVNKGAGSSLLTKPARLEQIVRATAAAIDTPLTLKVRMGYFEGRNCAHSLIPRMARWGASAVTVHGRTRQQRYSKAADWDYVQQCVREVPDDLQLVGNGDIFSYTEYSKHIQACGSKLATCMIARGALVKPWIFTEIKEQRHWDITAEERLNILRDYVAFGLKHWGSDTKGVETTRHFLLEWLSYAHRYIPVGLLEVIPQQLNWRPPNYFGRNDLETLMASDSAADWVRLTELVLGPPPSNFTFSPKHKSNAYDKAENG
ncbi:unnamed protein product [Sphagnum jensenii]|uniref:tRNA-dihydrouridine(47) synthase [NAD(P)(+)] n=1 Tax=Sphagnum jensenii TaxID=128206 RepID=A0ABP0X624_9BRYO